MCNAWNHPPGCTCGWGGDGHLGRRQIGAGPRSYAMPWGIPPIRASYESYTIPNARCPVCGASVFFYQSPDGGRVFFDELGPPWPKHPCTDHRSRPGPLSAVAVATLTSMGSPAWAWKMDGWAPFLVAVVEDADRRFVHLAGTFEESPLSLYIHRLVLTGAPEGAVQIGCPMHARERGPGEYDLSVFTIMGFPVQIEGYTGLANARRSRRPVFGPGGIRLA
jgi:hypothetical protein